MQINLLGFSLSQLKNIFLEQRLSELDAKRVFPWIHRKLAKSFDDMSDVPLSVRNVLKEKFSLSRGICVNLQKSSDGTQKALLEFADGARIETVFIPDEKRNTICLSSQVGCAMGCKFCNTGTQGFTRNLSASEIMAQVLFWKDLFSISNIVFMGMGEPLLNSENLFSALDLLLNEKTHNFSRNNVTVSTCGIIESQLQDLAKFGVKLAISLHAPNDELRTSIMPINRKYPLSQVINAAKQYQIKSNTNHVTFEYLLLKNINDSVSHAKELVSLLHGLKARINLIKYNDWENSSFKGAGRDQLDSFSALLIKKGIRTTIRQSKGADILAACGQLKHAKM